MVDQASRVKATLETASSEFVSGTPYIVRAGDNLTAIAAENYGVSRYNAAQINHVVSVLAQTNHLTNASQVLVGQRLVLPAIEIPENHNKTQKPISVQVAAVVHSTDYYVGTFIVEEPRVVVGVVEEKTYLSWHIERNFGMVCPKQIPEDGDNWRHIPIEWNLVEIYFHGLGNVDVRGLGEHAGVQCIYTPEGDLVTDELAGTRDFAPPVDPNTGEVTAGRVFMHTWLDVVPEFFVSSTQPVVAE